MVDTSILLHVRIGLPFQDNSSTVRPWTLPMGMNGTGEE